MNMAGQVEELGAARTYPPRTTGASEADSHRKIPRWEKLTSPLRLEIL